MIPRPEILVTGGTGFLGSHLIERLVKNGRHVRTLIRNGANSRDILPYIKNGAVEAVPGDIRDRAVLKEACKGIRTVFHSAAAVRFDLPDADFVEVNVQALQDLADTAMAEGIERFIHVSSIGPCVWMGVIDEDTPQSATNPYETTKLEGERILLERARLGFPLVILCPSAIYGPRARIVMPELLWYVQQEWMPMIDSGRHRLNLVHVSDVVDAMLLAGQKKEALGERFIIGHSESPTLQEILQTLSGILGQDPPPRGSVPYWIAGPAADLLDRLNLIRVPFPLARYLEYASRDAVLDISKARRILGYEPKIGLAQGMEETVRWFRLNTDLVRSEETLAVEPRI